LSRFGCHKRIVEMGNPPTWGNKQIKRTSGITISATFSAYQRYSTWK
jgi:hypothetical protein